MQLDYSWISGGDVPEKQKPGANVELDVFSLQNIKKALEPYEGTIVKITAEVRQAEILCDGDFDKIVDTVGFARRLIKEIKTVREGFTGKHYRFYKDCLSLQNILISKLEVLISEAQKRANEYGAKKRQEEMRKAREAEKEQQKLQKQLDDSAKKTGTEPVKLPVAAPAIAEPKPIRTEAASAKIESEWCYRIKNISRIPRAYMIVNDRAIKQAIKSGVRKIAGLEIYEETKTKIRSK